MRFIQIASNHMTILSLESHKKVDPAGQKPNTLNPDLVK